jgi:hypothetical protein
LPPSKGEIILPLLLGDMEVEVLFMGFDVTIEYLINYL